MKKFITSIFAMAFIATSLQAADIVVDSNGSGNYTTIQAAINGANPGDRILVVPYPTQYIGDLTINKSIEIVSQNEGERFIYQGMIYVNTASQLPANSIVTIAGMLNLLGGISTQSVGSGERNPLNIVNCKFNNGNILIDHNRYDARIHSDSLMNGRIVLRFGKVTGCYINSLAISSQYDSIIVNSDIATDDYVYLVGNKIISSNISTWIYGIFWNSTTQYYYIANNYVIGNSPYITKIYCANSKTGVTKSNFVLNNTIHHAAPSTFAQALTIANSLSQVFVENNLFTGNSHLGINGNGALQLVVSYNHFNTSYTQALLGVTNNGTNPTGDQTIGSEGQASTGTAINGGNPSGAHVDLDGSLNDAGCFGGSYSRANFLASSSGARTAFVIAPRKVTIGQPIDIFAEGFDY